jgi:N-acetylmuramoyl-L-alanine amidase
MKAVRTLFRIYGVAILIATLAFVPPLASVAGEGTGDIVVSSVRTAALSTATPSSAAKSKVKAKQSPAGSTRIVLQFEPNAARHDINYRWFTLPNPNRVVIDFGDITFKTPLSLVHLPKQSLVDGMRAGKFRPGTVRMVLDMQKPVRVNVFGIPGKGKGKNAVGPRMVIDVLGLHPGEKPTVVLPPADVVQAGHAPATKGQTPTAVAASSQIDATEKTDAAPVAPAVETKDTSVMEPIPTRNSRPLVVLDAGHGGVDPGACGKSIHLCEKGLTLDMVKRVRDELKDRNIEVILTRDSDVYIPLPDRPRVAQKSNADLFVSLHADMHPTDRSVRGATVYMVSEKASDREAARLMNSENDRDVMAGVALADETPEVQNILMSLVQRDTLNSSIYLGKSILDELGDFTTVRKRTLMSAGFRVLKSPDVPSVLVEMGYLSNVQEEKQLASSSYRAKLAKVIADGIEDYVKSHVHR